MCGLEPISPAQPGTMVVVFFFFLRWFPKLTYTRKFEVSATKKFEVRARNSLVGSCLWGSIFLQLHVPPLWPPNPFKTATSRPTGTNIITCIGFL